MSVTDITPRIGNTAPDWGRDYGIRELWTEIAPGLFVGGTADEDHVGVGRDYKGGRFFEIHEDAEITTEEFDAVVTMYAWARPVDWGVEELRWGIYDSPTRGIDLDSMADTVAWAHRRWKAGKRVLIRCQAGLNRSSLVAALVLVRDGVEPGEAIAKIRRTRSPRALFNPKFVETILDADPDTWRK
jgi:hypothetical protein